MSSQCPVTESLPADRSAMRPNAASGRAGSGTPASGTIRDSPRAASVGMCSATTRPIFPRVLLPWSP